MAKEVLGLIKLQIPAGGANPSPPVGPALGQRGLNIMDFCKAFNDKTKNLEKGAPIPVIITAYKDRSFDFVTKLPPVSYYLKKAAKIKKGNSTPGRSLVGKVSMSDIEKIAKEKRLGVWQGRFIYPWDWRRGKRFKYNNNLDKKECYIKGNISSKGQKIYHIPGNLNYEKTKINKNKGERWFCSEEEAKMNGWRKSKK